MAKKIVWAAVIVLVVLASAFSLYYRSISAGEWKAKADAAATVTSATYIRTVDRVETFIGEKPYFIAFGKDAEGREAIAWVDGANVHMEYVSAGITEEQARQQVLQQNPANEVLRVMPGALNGVYLWEVFYKRKEDGGVRYYYTYYRFDNGEEIDTWRLSKQK